jgi:uncharacterized membrane protein YvlD (DUF360 family)
MKKLILGVGLCWIGLSICNYFKLDTFGTFMAGSIAYGIYDIFIDAVIEKKNN